jgi:hypothetical protein
MKKPEAPLDRILKGYEARAKAIRQISDILAANPGLAEELFFERAPTNPVTAPVEDDEIPEGTRKSAIDFFVKHDNRLHTKRDAAEALGVKQATLGSVLTQYGKKGIFEKVEEAPGIFKWRLSAAEWEKRKKKK